MSQNTSTVTCANPECEESTTVSTAEEFWSRSIPQPNEPDVWWCSDACYLAWERITEPS